MTENSTESISRTLIPRIAIYPGTFDPITDGHVDVAERAARLFDELIVAVYGRSEKPHALFSVAERVLMASQSLQHVSNLSVGHFEGLAVNYARECNASTIVRGLRAVSDFEYEFKLAHMNSHLAPEVEVICLMTSSRYSFISSSLIREVASLGGDLHGLVPECVNHALAAKFRNG